MPVEQCQAAQDAPASSSSSTTKAACEMLPWDSTFFGYGVARVRGDALDARRVAEIDGWCREHEVRWLNFIARPDDRETVLTAERNGYHLADVRVTYGRGLGDELPTDKAIDRVRLCVPADVAGLRQIAAVSHGDSRVYHDANLPKDVCDRFFETWIKNSCEGYANAVLVTGEPGDPTGYVTCHLSAGGATGSLGLMAVDRRAQGHGLGGALMAAGLRWLADNGAQRAVLVTQGRNVVAQRVYQKVGFVIRKLELQYHKWYAPVAAAAPGAGNVDLPRAMRAAERAEPRVIEGERLAPAGVSGERATVEVG